MFGVVSGGKSCCPLVDNTQSGQTFAPVARTYTVTDHTASRWSSVQFARLQIVHQHNELVVRCFYARSVDGLTGLPSNANVVALSSALLEQLPEFADEATERICQQVEAYRNEQPVPRDDLNRSCRQNLEFGFRSLADVGPYDLSAPRGTG